MKRLTGRKILLATVALCAFGMAKAQNAQAAKDTLTLTLDKALTIALDENPTKMCIRDSSDTYSACTAWRVFHYFKESTAMLRRP